MDSLESLFLHLEHLDAQLPTREIYLHQDHLKTIKEVLLTKRAIKQRLSKAPETGPDGSKVGLEKIHAEFGYRIDRINDLYRNAVVCPACNSTDVAVIKSGTHKLKDLDFAEHRNRRVRLVRKHSPPGTEKFYCNICFNSFVPPIPAHIVKICELLFTYYY